MKNPKRDVSRESNPEKSRTHEPHKVYTMVSGIGFLCAHNSHVDDEFWKAKARIAVSGGGVKCILIAISTFLLHYTVSLVWKVFLSDVSV